MQSITVMLFVFFFNDTATTEIYTLSLHDALPISPDPRPGKSLLRTKSARDAGKLSSPNRTARDRSREIYLNADRSEEHTSELQSQSNLVCRLLLEKKQKNYRRQSHNHECNRTRPT